MTQIPAGWYRDPSEANVDGLTQRYWDGFSWSQHVRTDGGTVVDDRVVVPSTPGGLALAGWWMRVLATIVDGFIQIPLLVLATIPSVVTHWSTITDWWNTTYVHAGTSAPTPPVLDPTTGAGVVLYGSLFAANLLYVLVFLRWKQATPGKLMLGLRIRQREVPGPMPWAVILRRVGFVVALSAGAQVPGIGIAFALAALVDYLWPLWDSRKQALHDKVARTNVVRIS